MPLPLALETISQLLSCRSSMAEPHLRAMTGPDVRHAKRDRSGAASANQPDRPNLTECPK
jgi:hypothetical protein